MVNTADLKRSQIVEGVLVTVRRLSSLSPGQGVPDTYDLYEVKVGFGDWRLARNALESQFFKRTVKEAIRDMCQQLYEAVL